MLVVVGYLLVCLSVFGGFALAGGHLAALLQPIELLMIGGAALGAFFVGNSMKGIKATFRSIPSLFKGSRYSKVLFMQLMGLLYEVLAKVRKEGLMSIEGGRRKPRGKPDIFQIPEDSRRPPCRRVPDRLPEADGQRQPECLRNRKPDGQ